MTAKVLLALITAAAACPPTQRYDVGRFPPRCIDCPRVIANQVPLVQVAAQVRARKALKFSPGLPQNQTCGCWRANQTISVELNASWIVSGLVFNSNRGRWLREIAIEASDDNLTYIPWGSYVFRNFTDASMALFAQPIRARFFRVSVLRYANHYINTTTGFPLTAAALASQTQPFRCGCPQLASGECCPFANMTVRNDTCVWCMDPSDINTVVVDGCGQCKRGTFEYLGKCIRRRVPNAINTLTVYDPRSDGLTWSVAINVTNDSPFKLFLARNSTATKQYIQFDRGRYNMSKAFIREWASCPNTSFCTGCLGAVFDTPTAPMTITRPLHMDMSLPALVATVPGATPTTLARLELHRFAAFWAIRVVGVRLRGDMVHVAWNQQPPQPYNNTEFIVIPPANGTRLSVSDGLTRLVAYAPIKTVDHAPQVNIQLSGIIVEIVYGLGFASQPSPGDSEQIVLITAKSPQPIRLKRLMLTTDNGPAVMYTNAKGFIIDPTRVLDLSIACMGPVSAMYDWLARAMNILPAPALLAPYVTASCSKPKAYWLVPSRSATPRAASVQMQVLAEFS